MKAEPQTTDRTKGHMLTSETLRKAADLSDEIAAKQAELNQLLAGQITVEGTSSPTASPTQTRVVQTKTGKRVYTDESRARIAMAQKRRWRNAKKLAAQAQAIAAQAAAPAPAAPVAHAPAAPAPAPAAPVAVAA